MLPMLAELMSNRAGSCGSLEAKVAMFMTDVALVADCLQSDFAYSRYGAYGRYGGLSGKWF